MTGWTLIPGASLVAAPWRNGLGTSRDIASVRGADGGLGWTVSIADLERDGPFSHYRHADRVFTPIEGDPPPSLAFDGGPFEPCPLLMPKRFSGETPTMSRVPAPGRAFNAIVDRRRYTADVRVLRAKAGDVAETAEAGTIILHCLAGRAAAAGQVLGPGDSLRGEGVGEGGGGTSVQALDEAILLVVAIGALGSADPDPPRA